MRKIHFYRSRMYHDLEGIQRYWEFCKEQAHEEENPGWWDWDMTRMQKLTIQFLPRGLRSAIKFARFLRCMIIGHQVCDGDPGDPEVGPQPDVYCSRCGYHW